MQKPQLPGNLSTLKIPIPAVENQIIESEAAGEKAALQNRMLAIALTNTVIGILTSLALQWLLSTFNPALPQSLTFAIIAAVIGGCLGISTYALLMPLKTNFQQRIEAINDKLKQAEQTALAQEKQNQYLEEKLLEIVHNLDLTDERKLWTEEVLTSEYDATPTGSLLEFLDNFHKWSQLPTAPELLLGSSSLEEIQQRKDQLQYRQVWLQAILEETQREIKFIAPIAQLANPNQAKQISED